MLQWSILEVNREFEERTINFLLEPPRLHCKDSTRFHRSTSQRSAGDSKKQLSMGE